MGRLREYPRPCAKGIVISLGSNLDVGCALTNEPWVEMIYATSRKKFKEPLCGFVIAFFPSGSRMECVKGDLGGSVG